MNPVTIEVKLTIHREYPQWAKVRTIMARVRFSGDGREILYIHPLTPLTKEEVDRAFALAKEQYEQENQHVLEF